MNPDEHPFAQYVRTLGKGRTGSRSLTAEEAEQAMQMILQADVEPEQIGAFLMLLRVKEESPEEIAGFVRACRKDIANHAGTLSIKPDLDWSSYAGKRRQPHWFVLAILLLASNSYRVFVHGAEGHTAGRVYTREVFEYLSLPVADNWNDAATTLEQHNLCYMPLQKICPQLQELIQLRNLFGLRSPVHTLCRLLNPLGANTTLQSVFHPSYANTHHQAAKQLGEINAAVFKGEAGEVEYRPRAKLSVIMLRNGQSELLEIPKTSEEKNEPGTDLQLLKDVWSGSTFNAYYENTIIGTAAIALHAIGETASYDEAVRKVTGMWQTREKTLLSR